MQEKGKENKIGDFKLNCPYCKKDLETTHVKYLNRHYKDHIDRCREKNE